MNILLLNHYAGSPALGMEFRPYYLAKEWIKMGHRVSIIAGDYSHLRQRNPNVKRDLQNENIDGISYYWIKTGAYEGNGIKRALTMLRFVIKVYAYAKRIVSELQPDVVISSSTYPLDTYAGQRIRKISKKKVKLIHEVHDMWPATLIELGGMSKRNPFVVMMQIGENCAYRNSDKIVSLPPLAKDYMVEHGMEPDKFVAIPNGIVVDDWKNPQSLPQEHEEVLTDLKENGKYIVGYFGGHALSNALEVLLDCAEKIEDESVQFVLVGDGVEKKKLVEDAAKRELNNITFLEPIEKHAIPSLCQYFDIIYIGTKALPLYRFGLCMNKMFDSFMSGKPLVCAITTPESPIEKHKCGIMVQSEDIEGIIKAVERIRNMTQKELADMGKREKKLAIEKYSYEVLAKRFETVF